MDWKFETKCSTAACRQFNKKVAQGLALGLAAGSAIIAATAMMAGDTMTRDALIYSAAKIVSLAIMAFCFGWSVLYGYTLLDGENQGRKVSDSRIAWQTKLVLWAGLLIGILGADVASLLLGVEMGKPLAPLMMASMVALLATISGLVWPIYNMARSQRKKK